MIIFFGSKNLHTLVQDNIDSFMKMFLYLYKDLDDFKDDPKMDETLVQIKNILENFLTSEKQEIPKIIQKIIRSLYKLSWQYFTNDDQTIKYAMINLSNFKRIFEGEGSEDILNLVKKIDKSLFYYDTAHVLMEEHKNALNITIINKFLKALKQDQTFKEAFEEVTTLYGRRKKSEEVDKILKSIDKNKLKSKLTGKAYKDKEFYYVIMELLFHP